MQQKLLNIHELTSPWGDQSTGKKSFWRCTIPLTYKG